MKKSDTTKQSQTDLERIRELKDSEIDVSDVPEIPEDMFARAIVRKGLKKVSRKSQLTLRIDSDVLEWYRRQGSGYQTRINSLLRAYMEAHES